MFARLLTPVWTALAAASLVVACGGGGGGGTALTPTPSSPVVQPPTAQTPTGGITPATPQATLSGSVVKGPAANAIVRIYALDASGKRGALLAEVKTGADGGYSATIPASASGFLIEADLAGADIQDEVTGTVIKGQAGDVLSAAIVAPTASGSSATPSAITTHVTPFSSMATEMARKLGGGDLRPADVVNANDKVQQWAGSNFLTTAPQTQMQTQLRAVSQLVRDDGSLTKALQTLTTAVKTNADGSVSIDGAFSLKLLDACKQSGASGCDTDTHFGDRELAEKPLSKSPTDLPASPTTPAASSPTPAASAPTPAASKPSPAASSPSTTTGGTTGTGSTGGTGGGTAPSGPTVVTLDASPGTPTSPTAYSAAGGAFVFQDDTRAASQARITGFGADDRLALSAGSESLLAVSSQGSDVTLIVNQSAVVSRIVLAGVITPGQLVYDLASFKALGLGQISFDAPAFTQASALDALGGTLTTPATFDTSLGSYALSDDTSRPSVTRITGFGADDSLRLVGTSAAAVSVSSQGRDVRLVVNQSGVVSSLTLVDVIAAGTLVYDVPSFNALPIGDVSFQ